MKIDIVRKTFTEIFENLSFKVRHTPSLTDFEKKILQELLFNEMVRTNERLERKSTEKNIKKLKKRAEKIGRKLEKEG
jgi:hypothetical protein|uniref:Uncharacterized protein n=1 Tax=Siphoviridae sp. ctnR613 TaxID=2827939 RepID=A0A8S5SNL7_9CAUD|nr:MAG TPA: hypothetical protein [Siphoviridae sp. ctnR613]